MIFKVRAIRVPPVRQKKTGIWLYKVHVIYNELILLLNWMIIGRQFSLQLHTQTHNARLKQQ